MNLPKIAHANKLKGYSIIDLLPQNSETIIVDPKVCTNILSLLHHIIILLIESIDKFYIQRSYLYFDPHVGENACQIRAYMLFLLSKREHLEKPMKRINFLKSKRNQLKDLLSSKIIYKSNGRNLTAVELLVKHDIFFHITLSEVFLYESYFLTVFRKTINDFFYIDNELISSSLKISNFLTKKIVYKYQIFLSCISCVFIKKIAKFVGFKQNSYTNLLSSMLHSDGKMAYPCFFYSKILFMHMKKTKSSVMIILETRDNNNIRKDIMLFDQGNTQGQLILKRSAKEIIRNSICMVIICSRIASMYLSPMELLRKLNSFGLYNILLMNMAAHPQFSGSKSSILAEQLVQDNIELLNTEQKIEEEFLIFKKEAMAKGFCLENPSMLWVKHIFMDSISNQTYLHFVGKFSDKKKSVGIYSDCV